MSKPDPLPTIAEYGEAPMGKVLPAKFGQLPAQAVVCERLLSPTQSTKLKILVSGIEVCKVRLEKVDGIWQRHTPNSK